MKRLTAIALVIAGAVVMTSAPAFAQDAGSGDPNTSFVLLGSIGAAVALFLLIVLLFGPNKAVERDLQGRLGAYSGQREDRGRLANFPLLRRFVNQAESVAEQRGLLDVIDTALAQANLPLRPGEAIAGMIGIAFIVGIVGGLFARSLLVAAIAAVVTMVLSGMTVQMVAGRERSKFERQLPDTLNLISTSLRAGYSLLQAVEAVASEAADPTAREFGRAMSETRLGRSPVDALTDVATRMGSVDFEWAVLAISIQREVGGNLAEVLQTAANTMLQRNRLRREMKALTAEGRISAMVLGGLPFGLFAFLYLTNPTYLQPLFRNTGGIIAVVGALVMLVAGIVWLNKIVKVNV
ncbi:MAG TPA: type II secretion system F family protein [Acidimicrobiia bacterium]